MKRGAGALLVLPDGRVVLQRRTKDAPSGAGKLSFFGGTMEPGEKPLDTVRRELGEETGLKIELLEFVPAVTVISTNDAASHEIWEGNIFWVKIASLDFAVFEGDGAEAYGVDELMQRSDLTPIAKKVFDKLFGETHGTKHH